MNLHFLDLAIVGAYIVLTLYIGWRHAGQARDGEDFFLAGRKLGRVKQFFLNLGNSADANGAVSTTSLVYQNGVSGIWMSFQVIFLNPYYWFMNLWFRRVRLVTTGDLFIDRFGSRNLATFYALFQTISITVAVIAFGNFITYKISSALVTKPEAVWTAGERASVEGHQRLLHLEQTQKNRPLAPAETGELQNLRERQARGELAGYITKVDPWMLYVGYTLLVGFYLVLGGMAATAATQVSQSILEIVFSLILIPVGLYAIGGFFALGEKVPAQAFDLISADGQFTWLALVAILSVTMIQMNGIVGNMGISGSAKDEFAARFGASFGTFAKRILIIMWAFCGLIALALYQGPDTLADPDAAWGLMSRQLLGPGLLGLMIAGVLAANMSTVSAQTMAASALVTRNVWPRFFPHTSERSAVLVGRWSTVAILALGIGATAILDNIFSAILLLQTVNVPFGATVMLLFFWRRLTLAAVWTALLACSVVNLVLPLALGQFDWVREHPALTQRVAGPDGRLAPVYFDRVILVENADGTTHPEGRGRLHLELCLLRAAGMPVADLSSSQRLAARLFFNALAPFALLLAVSPFTRPPPREKVDLFFGKMKTPVAATPELDVAAMEETRRNPARFDHTKLFPGSSWEFTKWNRVDTTGFLVCVAFSGSIIALFVGLLRWASG